MEAIISSGRNFFDREKYCLSVPSPDNEEGTASRKLFQEQHFAAIDKIPRLNAVEIDSAGNFVPLLT